jgi:hypothetical protein
MLQRMASTNPIPPAAAALFARRTVVPAPPQGKQPAPKREDAPVALAAPPPRYLRRGSLLNLLV